MSRSNTRERWTRIISEQQMSGLNVAKWCSANNIDKASFYAWRKRLSYPTEHNTNEAQFIELSLKAEHRSCSQSIVLQIGRFSVSVNEGFNSRLLSDVLSILEARQC